MFHNLLMHLSFSFRHLVQIFPYQSIRHPNFCFITFIIITLIIITLPSDKHIYHIFFSIIYTSLYPISLTSKYSFILHFRNFKYSLQTLNYPPYPCFMQSLQMLSSSSQKIYNTQKEKKKKEKKRRRQKERRKEKEEKRKRRIKKSEKKEKYGKTISTINAIPFSTMFISSIPLHTTSTIFLSILIHHHHHPHHLGE